MNRVSTLAILLYIFSISRLEAQEHIFLEDNLKKWSPKVSLVQLKSTPEKYDGKRVAVQGVFSYWFENISLYFSKEDYDYYNEGNKIAIDLYTQNGEVVDSDRISRIDKYLWGLNGKVVNVVGTFRYHPKDPFDQAVLTDIAGIFEITIRYKDKDLHLRRP